jgi:hypothetical protein
VLDPAFIDTLEHSAVADLDDCVAPHAVSSLTTICVVPGASSAWRDQRGRVEILLVRFARRAFKSPRRTDRR